MTSPIRGRRHPCVKPTLNNATTYYIYDGENGASGDAATWTGGPRGRASGSARVKPILEYHSAGTLIAKNLYGKGIDEPSEWGHREMDGQACEGSGRDERERASQILMRIDYTFSPVKK